MLLVKIGIFDPYLDDLGGGEKYMITIAECLSQKHEVDVFWDNAKDLKNIAERFALNIFKVKISSNIFSPKVSFIEKLRVSKNYDAIIVLSDGSIPVVLSKKLFIHFQQPLPNVKQSLKLFLKTKKVNAFFCNSHFTKSFIDKEFGISSKVIYPPVEADKLKAQKENIILHVGRFRAVNLGGKDYKKQDLMIKVFKQMVDKGLKDWRFNLAIGLKDEDKEKFAVLQKRAQNYPIDFLLNVSRNDLEKIYAKSKIYWHASGFGEDLNINPQLAEHFGISTVEAMSAGCVPVVINAGGQKEIVENGKNGFLWNTLPELESKTIELITNEKLLTSLSQKAKDSVKQFNKEKFYDNINELILQ